MSEDVLDQADQLVRELETAVALSATRTEHIRTTQLAMKAQSLAAALRAQA